MSCFLNRSVWDAKNMALPLYPLPWPTARCVASQPSPSTRLSVSTMKYGDPTHMGRLSTSTNTQLINSTPHIHPLLLLNQCMNQSITEWMHDWINESTNQSTNQSMNWVNVRMNEQAKEWVNETKQNKAKWHVIYVNHKICIFSFRIFPSPGHPAAWTCQLLMLPLWLSWLAKQLPSITLWQDWIRLANHVHSWL